MNNETFEEVRVPVDDVDNKAFLVEGQNVKLLKFRDNVIGTTNSVILYNLKLLIYQSRCRITKYI